ncbi:MAG: ubiquinol-cytochrome C chaperone [Alphaproteobacteria bacterium]|nr:ubiquinol-cytochrome C chaperone [Alphaproteobacteria bacterium]
MVIFAQLQRLFTSHTDKKRAQYLYIALVEQARNPVFYTELAVPDTLDGRFDMIILHMHLVLQRLQAGFERSPELRELSRELIEYYFADMDRSLREMGVGDTGIRYRVQKMSSAFYGRLEAYGMADDDPKIWPEALRRNIYGTSDTPTAQQIAVLTQYIKESQTALTKCTDDVTGENLSFAEIESGKASA